MSPISKLKTLVVDDAQTVRLAMKKMLEKLGVLSVQEAESSDSAWDQLVYSHQSNEPIDIIFCDWHMPGGNGVDLLKKIRSAQENKFRLTKFIMITGADDKTIQAMDAGAHNVLHKPFTEETIKAKLELIFGPTG